MHTLNELDRNTNKSSLKSQPRESPTTTSNFHSKELNCDKAWGFFNDIRKNRDVFWGAPYYIRPFPDDLIPTENSIYHYFEQQWRLDVLRPLYAGFEDYFIELFFTLMALIIIPRTLCYSLSFLLEHTSSISDFIGTFICCIFAIIWASIVAPLAFSFSILGLITRPIMTVILGTNDPELKGLLEYEWNDTNPPKSVEVKCYYLKGNCRKHIKTVKIDCPVPLDIHKYIADTIVYEHDVIKGVGCSGHITHDRSDDLFVNMSERRIFSG